MNINKNVSIWRGNNPPPSQYHLWQKGDVLLHYNGLEWVENKVPMSSADLDGLMSKEDKDKLDNLDNLIYENLVGKETSTNTVTITRDATKTAIKVDVKVSPLAENSILKNSDGLYHSIDLEYSNGVLSTIVNGQVKKLLTLGLPSIVENAYYDDSTEDIVLIFKLDSGESLTVRVPASGIVEEILVDNNNKSVTLTKTRNISGKDYLSAEVNISDSEDNILEKDGNVLIVRGTSDNITHNNIALSEVINGIINEGTRVKGSLEAEILRATAKESEIENNLNDLSNDLNDLSNNFNNLSNTLDWYFEE